MSALNKIAYRRSETHDVPLMDCAGRRMPSMTSKLISEWIIAKFRTREGVLDANELPQIRISWCLRELMTGTVGSRCTGAVRC